MVIQELIPLDSPSKWQQTLTGIQHTFFHTWENCKAMYLSSKFETYLYHFATDDIKIICPIAERKFSDYVDILTPYGFSGFVGNGDLPEFSSHWKKFIKNRNYVCGYIGLNPIFDNSTYFNHDEAQQYNNIYILDLTLTEEELLKNLSKNRKRQIKKWQKSGSNYILEKSSLINFFLDNYHDFVLDRKAASVYNFSKETLSFLLNLENILLVGAGNSNKVEAVSVFGYTPHVGDFLFNISLPEGKQHSVALLWYGITQLKSLNIPIFNFGGGIRENDKLAEFKERFGSQKLPLKCLKEIYNPEIYQKLCQQVNADPNDMTGYFPPYRKP